MKKQIGEFLERNRSVIQIVLDVGAWSLALPLAMGFRFDFAINPEKWGPFSVAGLASALAIGAAFQVITGMASGLYRGRWGYGTFDETAHLARTALLVTAALALTNVFTFGRLVPTSVAIGGGLLALVLMASIRYAWRLILEHSKRPSPEVARPALVFGAGDGGVELVNSMLRNPQSPYLPIAIIDDDPTKRNLLIKGVPVVGDRTAIPRLAAELNVSLLIVAVPSAPTELLRELSNIALEADLEVKSLPRLNELLGSGVGVSDVREITERDLLGRHMVDTDIDSIAGYLTAKRVLVTGAGGSIGSELSVQISRFAPQELILLDRDESALHMVQMRIEGRALLDSRNLVVADIRDLDRMHQVFDEHRPDVVFHAAALKHLPLLEMHPVEAYKTNVLGTQNVLEAAIAHGVDRFVNISTDKAADPTSVLGYTKRIAERLTAAKAEKAPGTLLSVRFGNVLGSRGSVLTAFRAQLESGGPITVTHPDITRYFMTVEEAVQLVIQAGAIGNDGEALVLDMGSPVRIDDVARRLIAQSPRPIEIIYTGLRPGEKLHEVLLATNEVERRSSHPLISHVSVPPIQIDRVRDLAADLTGPELIERLATISTIGIESYADPEIDIDSLNNSLGTESSARSGGHNCQE